MLSRSFTNMNSSWINLHRTSFHSLQIDIAILQNNTLTPVQYVILHEEILPHQKHDSQPILASYGTDHFSIRIIDEGIDIFVKLLGSCSFKLMIPFRIKLKTPAKKQTKSLHQQSLLINATDVTSDDDDHIYTLIPRSVTFSSKDQLNVTYQTPTLPHSTTYSTIRKPQPLSLSTSFIDTSDPIQFFTHTSQVIPFYDPSFFEYKNYVEDFILPNDFS